MSSLATNNNNLQAKDIVREKDRERKRKANLLLSESEKNENRQRNKESKRRANSKLSELEKVEKRQRNKESQRRSREKRLKLEQTTLTGTFYQSSHIIEMQKNYCFKRNTINFSMADLENDSEDDDQVYENFEVDEIHLSKRLLPTRKCRE